MAHLTPAVARCDSETRLGVATDQPRLVDLTLVSRWQRILGVGPDEKSMVLHIAAVFAVIQSTHAFGSNSADALFFLRFGVENLPFVILMSGIATMLALLAYSVGLSRTGAITWLPSVTAACALIAVGEWTLTLTSGNGVYPIIWIATQVVVMVSFTVMWNAATASATTRQAKRLYPLYASAGVAGAIVGNLATGPLATAFGTETLLGVQGLMLGVGALLLRGVARRFFTDSQPGTRSTVRVLTGAVRTVRASKLMRLTAAVMFSFSALFYFVVFPFNEAVAINFSTEAEVARFLGLFASLATAVTFFVSLLVTRRLFSRLGIVISLLIVPAVYALGFGVWLFSFSLMSAAVVRGVQWVMVNAVGGTATTALYNILPGRRRGQVMSFMTAVPTQLGVIAGGAVLMVATSIGQQALFQTGLIISLVAVVVVIAMRTAYIDAVVTAVRNGLVGVLSVPHEGLVSPFGRESIDTLTSHLTGPTPEERLIGILGLEAAANSNGDAIEPLTRDSDPRVRAAALEAMSDTNPDKADMFIDLGLADSSAQVRRHTIETIVVPGSPVKLGPLLKDPDPTVRASAAWAVGGAEGQSVLADMMNSDDTEMVLAMLGSARIGSDVTIDPSPFLHDRNPDVRASAIRIAPSSGLSPQELRFALDDPSVMVRRVSAETLALTPEGREVLLDTLSTGSVSATDSVLRALTPVDRFTDDYLKWAQREAARARFLTEMRAALLLGKTTPLVELLADVLQKRSDRLSDWVILGMTTQANAEVMAIVERGVRADDQETRSQAVEALDVLGDRATIKPLLDLLEATAILRVVDQREALDALSNDFDSWISSLARASAATDPSATVEPMPDSPEVTQDSSDSMTTLERIIALQRVSMFSALDPEDLELIANAVREAHFVGGETVYRAGDVGTEMMVIIDGEAVVTAVHEGSTRELARYGPGHHVGELALLQGSVRSADVRAGDGGLSSLRMADVDLRSILQERPGVAIAMLNTLAQRLAKQT